MNTFPPSLIASIPYTPVQGEVGDVVSSQHPGREKNVQVLFHRGVNRSQPPHLILDGECRLMRNAYYPRECIAPRTRPGKQPYSTDAGIGRLTGLHVYQKDDVTRYVVFSALNATEDDQELYYVDPATKDPVLISSSIGGVSGTPPNISIKRPSFLTYNGRLLIAIGGEYIKEWGGFTGGSPARAAGEIQVQTLPAEDEQFTVGTVVFTFKTARENPGEVALALTVQGLAANIQAAIEIDCYDVKATVNSAPNDDSVAIVAVRTGTAGNAIALTDDTGGDLVMSVMSGGANGLQLDTIDTYAAPQPSIIASDKNLRVVAAVDSRDVLVFSAPAEALAWNSGDGGSGVELLMGATEGNTFTAITPFLDELMIHKGGQNKEIFRVHIADPDTNTWSVTRRSFANVVSALNHRCAATLANLHVALDDRMFRVFEGTDTYDEIKSGIDGAKVFDLIADTVRDEAFVVVNPLEIYALVFPKEGRTPCCFHYGTRRWTDWQFGGEDVTCGAFSEADGVLLLGCADGVVYYLDPTSCEDDDEAFATEVISKSIGGDLLTLMVLKTVAFDYQSHLAGSGKITIVKNRNESDPKKIKLFTLTDERPLIRELEDVLIPSATYYLESQVYGRVIGYQQAEGENLALAITLTSGAASFNNAIMRVAMHGRPGK